jgi:hypothetical protein
MRFASLLILLTLNAQVLNAEDAKPKAEPKDTGENAAIEKLLSRLTDAKATFKERCEAEDELAKRPAKEVLPRLLPAYSKGMPDGGIYNARETRDGEHDFPPPWQIYYAVSRVWRKQIDGLPRKEAGALLAGLVTSAATDAERDRVCYALALRWDASAENDLAKILRNGNKPATLRQNAARALSLHGNEDYRDVMLQWAAKAEHRERIQWFNLLAAPLHKKRKGLDHRVVCLGFQLIQAERNKSPNNIHGAYFLACTAGPYVGNEFSPSTSDPKYKGKFGLSDQFFEDTVHNALRWWEKNREKYESK